MHFITAGYNGRFGGLASLAPNNRRSKFDANAIKSTRVVQSRLSADVNPSVERLLPVKVKRLSAIRFKESRSLVCAIWCIDSET